MSNFDRDIYFDHVRASLFGGKLTQQQVNGQEAILGEWEVQPWTPPMSDLRHLAYPLATTLHETASTMWPIEEYGKGQGQPYGVVDPETGQIYYGRGFVQLTWRDGYRNATVKLDLKGDADLEWHPEMALEPQIASDIMFIGMRDGWFRGDSKGRQTLARYFGSNVNDAYTAREIINGDKHIIPKWSNGVSIGKLIAGYHSKFLDALQAAEIEAPQPQPQPEPEDNVVTVHIDAPDHIDVVVMVNGEQIVT